MTITETKAMFMRIWPCLSGKKNAFLSGVRHCLTACGGILATNGIASDSGVESIIGIGTFLAGFLWGTLDEYWAEQQALKAKSPATTIEEKHEEVSDWNA